MVEYLAAVITETVDTKLGAELDFLEKYDQAREALHQNQGQLAKAKRRHFAELTEEEIARLEAAFQAVF
jgi:hypothetical protein